jgi:hypothetical protein
MKFVFVFLAIALNFTPAFARSTATYRCHVEGNLQLPNGYEFPLQNFSMQIRNGKLYLNGSLETRYAFFIWPRDNGYSIKLYGKDSKGRYNAQEPDSMGVCIP